jgi:hypothetical protein
MNGTVKFAAVVCGIVMLAGVTALHALWMKGGVAVVSSSGEKSPQVMTTDENRGAIIALHNRLSTPGSSDIIAQRVDWLGNTPWGASGVTVCDAADIQEYPAITYDGSGGAFIAWQDNRNTFDFDIYAQRVDDDGNTQWINNGIPICNSGQNQEEVNIVSNSPGEAIVTWADFRNASHYDIYAQRVDELGNVLWGGNGAVVCNFGFSQYRPQIVSDGAAGAIISWTDDRNGSEDIYAQRVNISGTCQWFVFGVEICTAADYQSEHRAIADGFGGAIFAWKDYRNSNEDIYAQRIDSNGDTLWPADGVAICTEASNQYMVELVSDGAGGAILTWYDSRSAEGDIYAQRIDAGGSTQWTADGIPVCSAAGMQYEPRIASDGNGGVIITWMDDRLGVGGGGLYAQRVDPSGNTLWQENGVPVRSGGPSTFSPRIISDGNDGAVITCAVYVDDYIEHLYGSRIDGDGMWGLPPYITGIADVPADQGGKVTVTWDATEIDNYIHQLVTHYSVWRSLSSQELTALMARGQECVDLSSVHAGFEGPAYRYVQAGAAAYGWEWIGNMDAHFLGSYTYTAPTLYDSSGTDSKHHHFFVSAHTSDPFVFWDSAADSGYSVDNLAPCPPMCLAGERVAEPEGVYLSWSPNVEIDIDGYRVYRGVSEDFTPGQENLLSSSCDTFFLDEGFLWCHYYKISAVDVHGNESGFSLLRPEDVTGVEDPETPDVPAESFLAQNYPNPFNPATTIRFGLREAAYMRLRIYDAAGRLVRTLVDGHREAKSYQLTWDGRDGMGLELASGIYFYRLTAGDFVETRKMVLLR